LFSFGDWPITKKKAETWGAPQNSNFYVKLECLPFGSLYMGEKGRNLGEDMR
jgi:hypothetical protein